MVVVRLGARAPLKSLSCGSIIHRRSSSSSVANLFGVTKIDSAINVQLAKSILQSSQTSFASRWNFDPITETPLNQGRFLWTPFKKTVPETLYPQNPIGTMDVLEESDKQLTSNKVVEIDKHSPSEDQQTRVECSDKSILPSCTNLSPLIKKLNLDNRELQAAPSTACMSSTSKSGSPKRILRQSKITEFGKIVKPRPRRALCKTPISRRLM